jgi:hypothetical protein
MQKSTNIPSLAATFSRNLALDDPYKYLYRTLMHGSQVSPLKSDFGVHRFTGKLTPYVGLRLQIVEMLYDSMHRRMYIPCGLIPLLSLPSLPLKETATPFHGLDVGHHIRRTLPS